MESGVVGRVEIDTSTPFRSVKEAVQLFGERVLVGEVYAHKLKEFQAVASERKHGESKNNIIVLTAQLEETKQSLEKAREEAKFMAYCIKSLKEELGQTKRELQRLKAREYYHKHSMSDFLNDPETEDLKFIENATATTMTEREIMKTQAEEAKELFQKKRYVKFASPPSLTQVIVNKDEVLERPPSVKKTKKKPLLAPLLGWLLSKRKGNQEEENQ